MARQHSNHGTHEAVEMRPAKALNPTLHWQPLGALYPPASVMSWLADSGSLTRRLQRYGHFQVMPQYQEIATPRAEESYLLGSEIRERSLIREVLLCLDGTPVVFARSILPLASLTGANRVLGHMAKRSLGAELFKAPKATREQVWGAQLLLPASLSHLHHNELCWGRQSRFSKRGAPLLVSEIFLPALWQRLNESLN